MCTFYHASTKEYTIGEKVSIADFEGDTTNDYESRPDNEKQIYDLLDDARPKSFPSRKKCIYLFSKIEQCQYYATGFKKPNDFKIYTVHSDDEIYGGFPFCLVNKIYQTANDKRMSFVEEYWHPTVKWKFLEYFTESIIIDDISPLQENRYSDDFFDDQDTFLNFKLS